MGVLDRLHEKLVKERGRGGQAENALNGIFRLDSRRKEQAMRRQKAKSKGGQKGGQKRGKGKKTKRAAPASGANPQAGDGEEEAGDEGAAKRAKTGSWRWPSELDVEGAGGGVEAEAQDSGSDVYGSRRGGRGGWAGGRARG